MLIDVKNISKSFGSMDLFEKLSFSIPSGSKIGLIGENGSGKSSLFKLLIGAENPTEGTIIRKKGLKIGYLEQLPQVEQGVTAYQVIEQSFISLMRQRQQLEKMEKQLSEPLDEVEMNSLILRYGELQSQFIEQGGYELDFKIQKLARGIGVDQLLQQQFCALSGGEQTKIGLVRTLLQEPSLLLLDEPTNHLDLNATEWLEGYLADYQGSVVIISHDRMFLDQVVAQIYELEDSQILMFHGNYSEYQVQKEAQLLLDLKNYEEQQKKIKKLKDAIRRFRQWGNESGNEDMYKKAKNMEKRLYRMEELSKPKLETNKIKLALAVKNRSGNQAVTFEEVSYFYGERELFYGLSFQLLWQQHLGIVGSNGVGKSTLIRLILKELEPSRGSVTLGSNVKIGYLPQRITFAREDYSILAAFRAEVGMEEGACRQFLASFLFFGGEVFRKVSQLSGGERMRLRLAILMQQETNLLILDEPTNHLDISTREVIEEVLLKYTGTILAVSHDRYFLNKLMDRTLWLDEAGGTIYLGNYQWASERR